MVTQNVAAQNVTNSVTLTYDGPSFANGSPIPTPYPDAAITAAVTVNHLGVDGAGVEMVVPAIDTEDVTFQSGGFGTLANVAVGPTVNPADYGYSTAFNAPFGKIVVIPTDPASYIRLISFKVATKDGGGDETDVKFYINKVDSSGVYISGVGTITETIVAGAVTTHTYGAFAGAPVTGAPSQGFELLWEARNGRLALDDFKFEVVSPSTERILVTLPDQTFTSGSGNSGTVSAQTAGVSFPITLTAVTNNSSGLPVKDDSYTGPKNITFIGPGGTPVYPVNPVTFTAGQATLLATTLKKAETTTITAAETGVRPGVASSSLTVNPGSLTKLQILAPGETAAPGTGTGKTGAPGNQSVDTPFNVTVKAVDDNWNLVPSSDNIHVTTSDPDDTEPGDNSLSGGTRTFSITPATLGAMTVTATDVTTPSISGTSSSIAVVAGSVVYPYTLTYDDLGVANNAPIPEPYPGIAKATVTHFGRDGANPYNLFEDVTFESSGFGDLLNVAKGPTGTPVPPSTTWGGVRIVPNSPSNHVRLVSFDLAALDDGGGNESVDIAVYDPVDRSTTWYFQGGVTVVGDLDNSMHTTFNFPATGSFPQGGNPIPAGREVALIWTANGGQVAVDNVQFEIIGATSLASAPIINSITVSEGMAVIRWSATAGQTYGVQYKEELSSLTWTDAGVAILATGTTAATTNLLGNVPCRFYRVILVR